MNIRVYFLAVCCLGVSAVSFADDSDIVEARILPEELKAEDVVNFWTPERLKQAQPFPMPGSEGLPLEPESTESGEPGEATATRLKPGKAKKVGSYTHQPYSPAGKLFFTTKNASHYCSAQYAFDNNTILTAAHCLTNTNGKIHSNMVFFRSFNGDSFIPYTSQIVIIKMGYYFEPYVTHAHYIVEKNTPYDVAVLCGEKSEVTPMKLFTDRKRVLNKIPIPIGYPSNFDKGYALYRVLPTKIDEFYKVPGKHFAVIATHDNPFGHGSSGGAWLRTTEDGKQNNAAGLNASIREDYPKVVFGPWFTGEVKRLFEHGKKKCK